MEYSYTKQLFVLTEFTFNLYQKRCLVLKNIEQQSTQNNRNENSAL